MNEELRARAIEHVARAPWVERYVLPKPFTYDELTPEAKAYLHEFVGPQVDATLSVVADWCDEQRARKSAIEHVGLRDTQTQIGMMAAFVEMAAACRPVGEET